MRRFRILDPNGCQGRWRRRVANARAAAPGSAASVIARTTTTRAAPSAMTWSRRSRLSMPPIAHHCRSADDAVERCGVSQQGRAGRRSARLGRRRPGRTGHDVVDAGLDVPGVELVRRVRRSTDDHGVADDPAGDRHRKIILAEVQDRRLRRVRDVGTIVDREQFPVPLRGGREDLQEPEFVARLESLLSELHDVHAVCQYGIQELGEIALSLPGIRTQIEPGLRQRLARYGRHIGGRYPMFSAPRAGYRCHRTGAR